MARTNNNPLTKGMSGAIGDNIQFRTFKKGTFSGKVPDMSHVIPSKNQTKRRGVFAKAVNFAQSVMKDPVKKAAYKRRDGLSVYHSAIKDYMSLSMTGKNKQPVFPDALEAYLKAHSLNEQQLGALLYIDKHKKLTNGVYQKLNGVSKATATRHLQELSALNLIRSNGIKGAGANYIKGSAWENNGLIEDKWAQK
jgi:hypothetical protein